MTGQLGLLFLGVIGALRAQTATDPVDVTLALTKGDNLVSVPLALPAAARRLDLLMAPILEDVAAVWFFDAGARRWQYWSPRRPATRAPVLPNLAGCYVQVDKDVKWPVTGLVCAETAMLPPLHAGWQLVGVGAIGRQAGKNAWEPRAACIRDLVGNDAPVLVDTQLDPGLNPVGPDYPLKPFQAYWLHGTVNPNAGGDPTPKGDDDDDDRKVGAFKDLPQSVQTKYNAEQKNCPTAAGTNEQIVVGDFQVSYASFKEENGRRMQGIGVIEQLPDGATGLLQLNGGQPFFVYLDCKDGDVVGAYAEGMGFDDQGELPGATTVGGSAQTIQAADMLYVCIYTTKRNPDGVLEAAIQLDNPVDSKTTDGLLQVVTPTADDADNGTDYWYVALRAILGQETFVSQVWKKVSGTVTAMHPANGWLLDVPESADGVYEPNSRGPSPNPADWYPCTKSAAQSALVSVAGLTPSPTKVRLFYHLLANQGAIENVTDNSLSVAADGRIYATLAVGDYQERVGFINGQVEFSPSNWDHVQVWFRPDPTTHSKMSIGASLVVRGDEMSSQGYTFEDMTVEVTLSPRLVTHWMGTVAEGKLRKPLGNLVKGLKVPLYLAFPTKFAEPDEDAWTTYNGTGATIGADFHLAATDPKGTKFEIPISMTVSWFIRPDAVCDYRRTFSAGFSVEKNNFDMDLKVDALQLGTITVVDGQRVKQAYRHNISTAFDIAFPVPASDALWGGTTVRIGERAQIRGDIDPPDNSGNRLVDYRALPITIVSQEQSQSANITSDELSIEFDSMRFESQPVEWVAWYEGFLRNTLTQTLRYAAERLEKPTFPNNTTGKYPAFCYPKRSSVLATLTLPQDLQTHFSGMSVITELEYSDPTKAFLNKPNRAACILQPNGYVQLGDSDWRLIWHEINLATDRESVNGEWEGTRQYVLAGAAELTNGDAQLDVNVSLFKDGTGLWMAQFVVEDFPDFTDSFGYGQIDELTFIVPLTKEDFFEHFQVLVAGSVDSEDIRQKLGLDDGIKVSGMIDFPTGKFSKPQFTLACQSIPLHNLDTLSSDLSAIGAFEVESLSNLTCQVDTSGRFAFNGDLNVIFSSFVEDPKTTPRSQWPRSTIGFTVTRTPASSGATWDWDLHATNLVIINFDKDGSFDLESVSGSFNCATKIWEFGATASFTIPSSWAKKVKETPLTIPNTITAQGSYFHGQRNGWLFTLQWDHDLALYGLDLSVQNITVSKASPWAMGFTGTVGLDGKTYNCSAQVLTTGGVRFAVPGDTQISWSLPGNLGEATISNLAVIIGEHPGLDGDVELKLPDSNPLSHILGNDLKATLQAGTDGFLIAVTIDKTADTDLGPLGHAGIALKELTVGSDGVFNGTGSITFAGHTVDLRVGMGTSGVTVMADFGDQGIDVELAGLFDLKLRNELGLMALGPVQILRIDSGDLKVGPTPWYGFEYGCQSLVYVLPDDIPPVGFGFFQTMSGKAYMYGFAINVGLSFPAPDVQDAELVLGDLAKAFTGGHVDWTNLDKLTAPSLGIKDVYLQFPKIPGFTYQDGKFQETDDLFKSIFGTDQLTFIDSLSVGPHTVVGVATADSVYDVIDALIPPDKRSGSASVNLRGFQAGASYDLRQDTSHYQNIAITDLPTVNRFIERVRYVDANCGSTPSDLTGGGAEIGFWYGNDWALSHRCGRSENPISSTDQVAWIMQHAFWDAAEFDKQDFNTESFLEAANTFFDNRVNQAWTAYSLRHSNGFQPPPARSIANLQAAILEDGHCLAGSFVNHPVDTDHLSLDWMDNAYLTWFGRHGDHGGMVYWQRRAHGNAAWYLDDTCTDCGQYGPYIHCDAGSYQAEFILRTSANTSSSTVAHLDIAVGHGTTVTSMDIRGTDFLYPHKNQSFVLNFILPEAHDDVELRVWRRGGEALAIVSSRLCQAGKAETRTVAISDDLGGGKAQVAWQAVDVRKELQNVQDIASALALPQSSTWDQHLQHIWNALLHKDSQPAAAGTQIGFNWSSDWSVAITINTVDRNYDVVELRESNNQLQYRAGRVQIYQDDYFGGSSADLTDDVHLFPAGKVGNDQASSVQIQNGGRVILYKDSEYRGTSVDLSENAYQLSATSVGNDTVSSARLWFDITDLRDVTDWQCVATSINGTQLVIDAGAMQVIFPGGQRLLWMPSGCRLATALDQARDAVSRLSPNPDFWDSPHDYLLRTWNNLLLPDIAHASIESDVTMVFPTFGKDSNGNACTLYKIGLSPFATQDGRSTTGVRLITNPLQIYCRYGTVTLYDDINYGGNHTVVTDNMASFSGSHGQVGNDTVSSIKCANGGKIMLFENANFKGWGQWKHWDLKDTRPRRDGQWARWDGGDLIVEPVTGPFTEVQIFEPYIQADQWTAGHYRWRLPIELTDYGNNKGSFSWQRPQSYTSFLMLQVKPTYEQECDKTWALKDLTQGHRQELVFEYTYNRHYKYDILEWKFYQMWMNSTFRIFADGMYVDREVAGVPTETLTASDPDLRNNTIGNDQLSSVQIWFPVNVQDFEEYTLTHSLAASGTIDAIYRTITTGKPRESHLLANLDSTQQQLVLDRDKQGNVTVTAANSMKMAYPEAGYTLYLGGDTKQLDNIADAADYVQIISRSIFMPEPATVRQNIAGAWTTSLNNRTIAPNPSTSGVSACQFSVPSGPNILLSIPQSAGGFDRAKVVGTDHEYWPLYANNEDLAAGVRKRLSGQPGGFFMTADLHAGDSDVVKLDITLAGSIEDSGDFSLTGNGDLQIADFTVAEAEIELSSENGFYIHGKVDIFDVARAEVEGYIRPDGNFSLSGSVAIVIGSSGHETGIKGAVAFCNDGLFINGGVYLYGDCLHRGSFEITSSDISWSESYGIGIAGLDYTLTMYYSKSKFGLGFDATLWVDVDIPIKIWGPAHWKCCCWGKICWPVDWGWHTVGHLDVNFDLHVEGQFTNQEIEATLGSGSIKVGFDYNVVTHHLSVHW